MLINELEKICDQNDLVDAYNEIKEIMSKEALTQDKIEKNFSDIQIAFDKAVNFFGDNCHASINWKTSTNRFNFFISNFLNDDEFNNLCQTLFKTMRENK